MTQAHDIVLVYCTAPNLETGREIANALVEYHLAACVNLLPGVESIYRWQEKIQHETEVMLIIKTQTCNYAKLESVIKERHPYELPEIITVPLTNGLPEYLDWVRNHSEAK